MLRKALCLVAAFWFWVLVFCAAYWLFSFALAALANALVAPDYCFFRSALLPYVTCTGLGVGQGTHHLLAFPITLLVTPAAFAQFAMWQASVLSASLHALAILYAVYRFGPRGRTVWLAAFFGRRLGDPDVMAGLDPAIQSLPRRRD
ncbi:MAG: hypothetical protein AB7S41_05435 [Parvibaculaceae bacterium]